MRKRILGFVAAMIVATGLGERSQAVTSAEAEGRYKLDGSGGCYWEPNDDGPNQCDPNDPAGRYKMDGGSCIWASNEHPPDQCQPGSGGGGGVPLVGAGTSSGMYYLDNGTIRLGINPDFGGNISHLEFPVGGIRYANVVDTAFGSDYAGREIQGSLYEAGSDPSCWPDLGSDCYWAWNPVQGGNANLQGSGSTVVEHTSTRIRSIAQPLHWKTSYGRSNVGMEQVVELISADTIQVRYTFTNYESFTIGLTGAHELPVVYLINRFSRAYVYRGNAPYTNAPMEVLHEGLPSPTSKNVSTTEPWVALQDTQAGGVVALAVPQGFSGYAIGCGVAQSEACLMQSWRSLILPPGQTGSVSYYLVVGPNISTVRQRVYQLLPAPPPPPPPGPGDTLPSGYDLLPGYSLVSSNGAYELSYQGDGNLVLYRRNGMVPLWWSGTQGMSPSRLSMQGDGNLILHHQSGLTVISNTPGSPGAYLIMQNDGNAVIYRPSGAAVWSTGTAGG